MVEAFDAKTKKHKVVYDDGDVEMLTLVNEEWRYADDMKRVEQEDIAIPEVSLEPPLKKRRASSGSLTKQEKAIATSESGSKSRGRPRGKLAYDSAGSKSPAKRKGRPPNQTSRPSTPNEEAAKTSGKDEGNKAESLKTTHSNDLLDDTKIVDAMTSSGSKPRGRPKSSAKLKRRRRSGGNSISETPTIEAKEAESSHRSSPHDETFSRKKQEDDSDVKSPDGSSSRSAGKTGRKRRK
ncbi:hypothetical protein AXF42_Ash007504 [Apostasia shenzhenica]|uniref:Uncharacterized protein n=1 Tax=Apostasia shenzhenica TaxID=1088818 RepID=A0A2I0A5M4_9ASPA|nr:hypothetical protein AXF42_Ash007504 [Apostasia shenzhenica]